MVKAPSKSNYSTMGEVSFYMPSESWGGNKSNDNNIKEFDIYLVSHRMQVLSISAPKIIGPGMEPIILTRSSCRPNAYDC